MITKNNLESQRPSKKRFISWLIAGIFLCTGPVWGVLLTMLNMILTFRNALQTVDTETMAKQIALAMHTTTIGFIMLPIGLIITIITIIKINRVK